MRIYENHHPEQRHQYPPTSKRDDRHDTKDIKDPSELTVLPDVQSSSDLHDFIGYLKIASSWANDPPEGFVKEITGGSPDMNYGFGGDYSWLREFKAYHAINPKPLIGGFHVVIRDKKDPHAIELNTGSEAPPYRLLYVDRTNKGLCVDALRFWRSKTPQSAPPPEWEAAGMTGNINEGRGGSYLYLVWHSKWYDGDDGENSVDEVKAWGI